MFLLICVRAFLIPFSHDEAATFFFYIQSDNYLPYSAHVYTNNHVLNSALANLCYHLFGSHRFVLRLPNIMAYGVMCVGIFKHFKYLKNYASKIALIAFFLLTINFLDFFELCRGYGLSFALMVLGMAYLLDYFKTNKINNFLFFSLCWQLALSANLILVVVLAMVLFFVFLFQMKNKLLFNFKTLLIYCFNLSCLIVWIKFSFFYKEKGVLDYGVGDNYWLVTFKTLILFLFGTDALWLQVLFLVVFFLIFIFLLFNLFKHNQLINNFFYLNNIYPILFIGLIMAFYFLKKALQINYPEDRTGLFFYLFFVFSFVFLIDVVKQKIAIIGALILCFCSLSFFCISFNLSNFSSFYYHTQPKATYDYLKAEQLKSPEQFTIGGHRVREMNYAFLNFRGNSVLNPMDNSEEMQMNCDYYFALQSEKPYYKLYYDEVMFDQKWERVLLKRKEKIKHTLVYFNETKKVITGENEFYELKKITDTAFSCKNPLEMEINLTFNKVPEPFNCFLVFSFEGDNDINCYKRVPLNWLETDLNNKSKILKLTSANLPDSLKNCVVYIWNIDKKQINVTLNSLKLYQLKGKGVTIKIPQTYYPLIESLTKKPIL